MELQRINTTTPSITLCPDKLIKDSRIEEIKGLLAHIISLIGVPTGQIPNNVSKDVMLVYIIDNWGNINLLHIKQAFEWAIETGAKDEKGNSILNLFGKPFNVEFIKSVYSEYRMSRMRQTNNLDQMPNHKRAESIYTILKEKSPEVYEMLKNIGKTDKEIQGYEPVKITNNPFQVWMRQYDNLRRKYQYEGRFLKIGETIFNIDSFLKHKLNNYNKKNAA